MVKMYNRQNCVTWHTLSVDMPCEVCGEEAEVLIDLVKILSTKRTLLCHECRRKWIKGEINL